MLEIRKDTTLNGSCMINGQTAETYTVTVNANTVNSMTIVTSQLNRELCKANREACTADHRAFEDAAYALQDEIITLMAGE